MSKYVLYSWKALKGFEHVEYDHKTLDSLFNEFNLVLDLEDCEVEKVSVDDLMTLWSMGVRFENVLEDKDCYSCFEIYVLERFYAFHNRLLFETRLGSYLVRKITINDNKSIVLLNLLDGYINVSIDGEEIRVGKYTKDLLGIGVSFLQRWRNCMIFYLYAIYAPSLEEKAGVFIFDIDKWIPLHFEIFTSDIQSYLISDSFVKKLGAKLRLMLT